MRCGGTGQSGTKRCEVPISVSYSGQRRIGNGLPCARLEEARLEVGYRLVVDISDALHPSLEASIVARLQNLQRSNFPVRRQMDAVRAEYGEEGLTKLVLTFGILAVGAPPGYVVELVDDGLDAVSETLAAAWATGPAVATPSRSSLASGRRNAT